jgi:hypothetical protein
MTGGACDRGCVRGKLKMNMSMRRAALDPATLTLPFFDVLGPRGRVVI